jgi:2-polyprenyl-3-methyl-5-hydroxy-6-metoxy-1,4-benzoquinol methylase
MRAKRGTWHETSAGIYYTHGSKIIFYDDWDHWRNGFCRLLEIHETTARTVIEGCVDPHGEEFVDLNEGDKIELIKETFRLKYPIEYNKEPDFSASGMAFDGSPADTLFAESISGNESRNIVGNSKLQFAWLTDARTHKQVFADSVEYDKLYFQDPPESHLGMRNYIADQEWRLEKARRQLRIVLNKSGLKSPVKTALDVGSAVGYFRKALDESQIEHYGLEQSTDAVEVCAEKFGFSTLIGEIEDLPAMAPELLGKIELITLWDVIEHLDDGVVAINILKQFLTKDGVIAIRTPNLVSLEYEILGDYYYSFKLDHIKYYSPVALTTLANLCGLKQVYLETTSHIFKGLLGMDCMHQCMLSNTGADIIAVYSR